MRNSQIKKVKIKHKLIQVRTMSCPRCKLGQAVHKKEAYAAYRSHHYAQLRKVDHSSKNLKPKPTVAKYLHIEGALLHPSFLKAVKPPPHAQFVNLIDSKWIMYSVVGIVLLIGWGTMDYLHQMGEDTSRHSPASSAIGLFLLTLSIFIFWLINLIDNYREKKFNPSHPYWFKSWLCLRCGIQFYIERSNDGKTSIYLL
jgi:hypothetical protein